MAQKRKSDFIDPDYTSFTHNIKNIKKPKVKEDENRNIEKIVVIIKVKNEFKLVIVKDLILFLILA